MTLCSRVFLSLIRMPVAQVLYGPTSLRAK